jgi:uncharacterized membrane protein
MRRVETGRRAISVWVVIACVLGTMALGAASKAPCAGGRYDGRQYRWLCYTDVVPLLHTEQLEDGRLPFIDPCRPTAGNCDEYPVLTMYVMRAVAWVTGIHFARFYFSNAGLMALFAVATAVCLWMLAGRRALWFALAPTLLVYGTLNWDLVAVACATGALVTWAARRDGWTGVLLGVGAAAKFYPAMLIVPLFLQGLQDREPDRSVRVLWWTLGTWVAIDLPFAIAGPRSWFEFFRFNSARTPDFDSAFYIACRYAESLCISIGNANLLAATAFVFSVFGLVYLKGRSQPSFPRWTVGVPLLICFLLTNKVYSPQFSLWLLPWFALTMPRLRRFVAFELADVTVFVTRFWFFASYAGYMELPQQWWFEAAIGVRTLVLVWCLVGWVRDQQQPLTIEVRGWRRTTPAPRHARTAGAMPA